VVLRVADATARIEGDDLLVTPLLGALREMKALGATWDARRGAWRLPAARWQSASVRDLLPSATVPDPPLPALAPLSDPRLYDWQVEAARRLVSIPRGQLLCASPGLGKTAMAVCAADAACPDDQVVVVSPASLLKTWEREIRKWCVRDATTVVISGPKPDWDAVRAARWLVISWDTFARHQDWFAGRWPLWVLDESVLAKSRRSTRSMAMRGGTRKTRKGGEVKVRKWVNLRKSVDRVWLLSGSPTTRHADDLWAQLNLIWPRAYPSYWRFAERYCHVEETVWAKVVTGDRRDRDAARDSSDLMTVINQEDVLDLPEYLFEAIDVDLTPRQRRAYDEMTRDFIAQLDSGDVLVAQSRISQLLRLQQIASYWEGESSKHDAVVDLIAAGAYEPPYLLWTHWRDGADALARRLEATGLRVAHAHGGMSATAKDSAIEDYKRGAIDALVLSVGVGKFGHTLVNTSTVFYIDKTFNADDYTQSLRRVRRIGLEHRPVVVTVRAPGTTDELVELNLEGKVGSIARITNADLRELIAGLGKDMRRTDDDAARGLTDGGTSASVARSRRDYGVGADRQED
jgi:SNF2 family DNA or RNA helicase